MRSTHVPGVWGGYRGTNVSRGGIKTPYVIRTCEYCGQP